MLYFVIHHAVIQHFVIHHVEFAGGGGYSVCSKLSLCRTVQAFFFTFYLAKLQILIHFDGKKDQ